MKKVFSIFFLAVGTQIMHAHPDVEHHAHDSLIGEWAWLIIPVIALIAFGRYYAKRQTKKRLG